MKKKILFILVLSLISCSKEKINKGTKVTYKEVIGTWISQDEKSHYSSFTFTENEKYSLTERENENPKEGTLKFQDNKIRLDNLGLIKIINLDKKKGLSFSLLEKKNTRSFYLTKKKE